MTFKENNIIMPAQDDFSLYHQKLLDAHYDYVAYTEEFIHEHGDLMNVELGDLDVVVAYHKDFDSVGMYVKDSRGPVSRIEFGGNSDRGQLSRLPTMKAQAYWVVWQNFFPQTNINRPLKIQAAA